MAASSDKVNRKDLKEPDEFQVKMGKAIEFVGLYGGWMLAGAAVLIVAILGGVWLSRHGEAKTITAAVTFDKAFAPVVAAANDSSPSGEEEAADARKKRLDDAKAKAKGAVDGLDKVASQYAGKPLGTTALAGKAAALALAGDADAAHKAYKTVSSADPTGPMAFVIFEALGTAADAAGQRDEAEKAWTEMAKAEGALPKAQAYLHLGDLHAPALKMKAGDPADAAKAKDFYEKGLAALPKDEQALTAGELLTHKTLQQRLLALR